MISINISERTEKVAVNWKTDMCGHTLLDLRCFATATDTVERAGCAGNWHGRTLRNGKLTIFPIAHKFCDIDSDVRART